MISWWSMIRISSLWPITSWWWELRQCLNCWLNKGSLPSHLPILTFQSSWRKMLSQMDEREVIKKTGKKRSGWLLGLTPAPMKRSGKCEICWLWFLTLVYDYIWPKTNFTKKIFFDHRKFLWRLLETLHDIHGFSCLGAVKKAIKIHQKCIFQPLHNEVKSVLGIKESYSVFLLMTSLIQIAML